MNCLEVLEQMGEYLDKEASEQLCKAIDEHLRACPNCKFEVDSLQKTMLLTHPVKGLTLPPQAKEKLQQVLGAAYQQRPSAS
jgi:predicted anti-sigma-YlaC factor YlaD